MNITVKEFESATVCINKGGSEFIMTNRSSCSIIVTKSGAVSFTQSGGTVISSPGNPIFIPQGTSYTNRCLENAESMMVNFKADTDISEVIYLSPVSTARFEGHYDTLYSLSVKSLAMPLTFSEKCRATAEIYSILALLTYDKKECTESELLFEKASEFIISSISNPSLDCALAASHLNISEVYLRRIFVKYAGIPTWKYIRKIRLEKARQLLLDKATVKSTAYMTGYPDVYSFSRAYKDYFGYPPSKT